MSREPKNVRRVHFFYDYTDLTALEEYLAAQAAEGWRLTNIRSFLTFERCEPTALRYSVEIIPTASQNSNEINEKTADYIRMCQDAGWTFVSNAGDVYVFVTEDQDAPPIVTDDGEKIRTVARSFRNLNLLLLSITVLNIGNAFLQLSNYLRAPEEMAVMLPLCVLLFTLDAMLVTTLTIRFAIFHRWHRRAKDALDAGLPIPYNGMKELRRTNSLQWRTLGIMTGLIIGTGIWAVLIDAVFGGIIFGSILAVVALTLALTVILNRQNWSTEKIVTVTVVSSLLLIALTVAVVLLVL